MDMVSVAESKESGTKIPHEYTRDILPFRYQECASCGNRTDLACIKCAYCYSNYYRCNHEFSVHGLGSHDCKCKHPTDKAHGESLRVLLFLYTVPLLLGHNPYQILGS